MLAFFPHNDLRVKPNRRWLPVSIRMITVLILCVLLNVLLCNVDLFELVTLFVVNASEYQRSGCSFDCLLSLKGCSGCGPLAIYQLTMTLQTSFSWDSHEWAQIFYALLVANSLVSRLHIHFYALPVPAKIWKI